ncbi:unnamed protein product [Adineta ricciae]|uniref:G-protein coupled receptors family 1 profile domain-containing protein n=1 Tax=Adineta ricciae TaxID=249248 RepID=A0A814R1V7_ADIRI|nr:unnamed protein product [Adineta ricciae]
MSNVTESSSYSPTIFSPTIQAYLYLIPNIIAIFTSIFVLYHLLFDRALRQALNNHIIIVILFTNFISDFTSTPWLIYYNFTGTSLVPNPIFSLVWVYIDYASYALQTMLFAWATIERHILVFHDQWLRTTTQRIFIHYLPTTIIFLYVTLYYLLLCFVRFCSNIYDYSQVYGLVDGHCELENVFFQRWCLIFDQTIPTMIIIISNIGLLERIFSAKRRAHQAINWRKQRRMIIQLLSLSVLFFVLNVPYLFVKLAYTFETFSNLGVEFSFYTEYFVYYIAFLLPLTRTIMVHPMIQTSPRRRI